MILGTFAWRGMEIEADCLRSKVAGETVWLNRIDTGSAIWFAIVRNGQLHLTNHAPVDNLATIQLRSSYDTFRATTLERS
jgi:hypothetical protein